jgi:hypothetical protein
MLTTTPEPGDYQPPPPRSRYRLPERFVLERVHRRPVDWLDSVELGQDRRERGSVEADLHAHRRQDDRHAIRLGGLGQQPDMQLDQVGGRLRSDHLEHLILVIDQHEGAVLRLPDTQVLRHR